MLKFVFVCSFLFAVASATVDFDLGNNFVDLADPIYGHHQLPYAYQGLGPNHYGPSFHTSRVTPVAQVQVAAVETNVSQGLLTIALSCAYDLIVSGLAFLLRNGSALLLGSAVAIGLCKLTSLCDNFTSIPSIVEIEREIRSIATPDRITRAAEFVRNAINKYNAMQN